MGDADTPTVLVVEDEPSLRDIYIEWLGETYEVRTAENGAAALERLDADGDVDVALLDRRMPGMGGEETLAAVRERVPDCKVAMVTAVEPDFDIIAMGFDDYLTKPIDAEELLATVERLLAREAFAVLEREFYALVTKWATLQAAKSPGALANSEEFDDLEAEIETLRARLDATMPAVEDGEFVAMVRDLEADARNGDGEGTDQSGDATRDGKTGEGDIEDGETEDGETEGGKAGDGEREDEETGDGETEDETGGKTE